jgi:hypothetical protein
MEDMKKNFLRSDFVLLSQAAFIIFTKGNYCTASPVPVPVFQENLSLSGSLC